jgi:hypothetical protein
MYGPGAAITIPVADEEAAPVLSEVFRFHPSRSCIERNALAKVRA